MNEIGHEEEPMEGTTEETIEVRVIMVNEKQLSKLLGIPIPSAGQATREDIEIIVQRIRELLTHNVVESDGTEEQP